MSFAPFTSGFKNINLANPVENLPCYLKGTAL
jgi:hypothetical protein